VKVFAEWIATPGFTVWVEYLKEGINPKSLAEDLEISDCSFLIQKFRGQKRKNLFKWIASRFTEDEIQTKFYKEVDAMKPKKPKGGKC
jgi:hypothetical protein